MRGLDTSERPVVFIWELTQACELSCEHCRADAQPHRHPDELSTAEGKQLLEDVSEFGEGQLVVLSGGDPCKREDLVELVDYGTDLGLSMTLTPSGTDQLTREVIQDLADVGLKRMALSIDGPDPDSHDAFRGEAGSFEQTMRAAKAAADVGVPLQINTTVCRRTVGGLPELRTLVADLDAVLWSVFFLVPVGRGRVLDPISPERADDVMSWLGDVSDEEEFAVKTTEAPQYRRVLAQGDADGGNRRGGVIAGDGFAFVSHTGEMYPSGFLPESVGNVTDEDPVDLYRNAELFERLRDRDQLKGKCGACPFRSICGGSRSRAYAYTGDPLESDPLCPFVPPEYDGPLPEQEFASGD
ncbi:radical SAM protein [Halovenus sp. WSH3]|uniref:Radical SAM protein n=1 Tax=Halovenus carboxidivorans TaxID=2692199 RepID=A0A6B0SZE5_9EURY|nr:radical SAM protein [Halovenus carboxidivorans]MXR51044.1 radical SAM protein [Halovenus carboxidivorans]